MIDAVGESDDNFRRDLVALLRSLRQEALCNVERYRYITSDLSTETKKLYSIFSHLFSHLDNLDGALLDIFDASAQYDFKTNRVNGYRSLVKVTRRCLVKLVVLVRHITVNENAYLFRKNHYIRELETYVMVLGQIRDVLAFTRKLMDYNPACQLFPCDALLDTKMADKMQMEMDTIDQEWFYGRALGFQYCESLKRALEVVHVGLATYSHNYDSQSSSYVKLAGSLLTSSQYFLYPETRARKVVEVTLSCDVEFCKAFWGLPESDLLHNMARLAMPVCSINHVFQICTDDLLIRKENGEEITIKSPTSHIGQQNLQLRIISSRYRLGQEKLPNFPNQSSPGFAPSKCLIIHCHGGGFVSQTSRTHEGYLRFWANDIEVPMLCIDYSLAPAAPYPRALEEVYYAYAWALANKEMLGTTVERIAVVGDSAGGNLLLAMMLKVIQDGLRLPDGIVAIYTPVYIQFIPSPSRTLSVMDALLPIGILTRCLEAYAGDHIEAWTAVNDADINSNDERAPVQTGSSIASSSESTARSTSKATNHMHEDEEEDEEIKSLMINGSPNNISPTTAKSPKENSNRHINHRRTSLSSHSRSESMPVSPKVQSVIPQRHDKNRHFAQSPLYKFSKLKIRQDPFLSPLLASDCLLKKMPATYLVCAHLDPCLDDSVTFAKKLDSLGVEVHLDAIDDVPHGFLNFALASKECMQAVHFCRDKLKECLRLNE